MYEGIDALITRELRMELSVSWGDISRAGALVRTARCFGGVLDRIQMALESVMAGRSTLLELCTKVTQAIDRGEIAARWSAEVHATTLEWPPSAGWDTPYCGLSSSG